MDGMFPYNKNLENASILYSKSLFNSNNDLKSAFNNNYEAYLDFYIDYKHYIERLERDRFQVGKQKGESRYLRQDSKGYYFNKTETVESLFPELTGEERDRELTSRNNPIHYSIENNTIKVYVGVAFENDYEEGHAFNVLTQQKRGLIIAGISEYWNGLSENNGNGTYSNHVINGNVYDFMPELEVSVEFDVRVKVNGEFWKLDENGNMSKVNFINEYFDENKKVFKIYLGGYISKNPKFGNGVSNAGRASGAQNGSITIMCASSPCNCGDVIYKRTAAHEFGHSLGLWDAYPEANNLYAPINKNEITGVSTMMYGDFFVSANNIEMALYSAKNIYGRYEGFHSVPNQQGVFSKAIREKQIYKHSASGDYKKGCEGCGYLSLKESCSCVVCVYCDEFNKGCKNCELCQSSCESLCVCEYCKYCNGLVENCEICSVHGVCKLSCLCEACEGCESRCTPCEDIYNELDENYICDSPCFNNCNKEHCVFCKRTGSACAVSPPCQSCGIALNDYPRCCRNRCEVVVDGKECGECIKSQCAICKEHSCGRICNTRMLGDVDGSEKIELNDAVQVLMFVAKLPASVIYWCDSAFKAAIITKSSVLAYKPMLGDAVQIIMYIAKPDGILSDLHSKK